MILLAYVNSLFLCNHIKTACYQNTTSSKQHDIAVAISSEKEKICCRFTEFPLVIFRESVSLLSKIISELEVQVTVLTASLGFVNATINTLKRSDIQLVA